MVATTTITATQRTREQSSTSTAVTTTTAHATAEKTLSFRKPTTQEKRKVQEKRLRAAPAKYNVNGRHLDEFTSHYDLFLRRREHAAAAAAAAATTRTLDSSDATTDGASPITPKITKAPTEPTPPPKPQPLKEPLSIKPMRFINFLSDGLHLYLSHVLHPSRIPGNDIFSRVYAMGVLPVLIVVLTLVQGGIGLLVILVNYTRIGARFYSRFFDDQIALFDDTDFVDPDGTDEALRQLADRQPRDQPRFSYHIANLLLIMSSMSYQRNDKLVARASKILLDVRNESQRAEAAKLLQESEKSIDEDAQREFGMRFMGISELKTLGGPYAGLFYNDNAIVLVFKGTSVLAFNEYLIDVTIQRVDASEYLYGEVHQGFYESLFPDAKPEDWYESVTYDQTNPFNTVMHSIFEIARISKHKTGKPVNLWLTGHSLGGALVALVMARLQMPVQESDPLNQDEDGNYTEKSSSTTTNTDGSRRPRTVLEEMLARFSDDPDLLVLRDAYSQASPKIGDSTFAEEFATNHVHYCKESPYKTTYWRMAADNDVVPLLPPGCSVDPSEPCDRPYPSLPSSKRNNWLRGEPVDKSEKTPLVQSRIGSHHTLTSVLVGGYPNNDVVGQHEDPPRKHLNSLLDYQHVGQLVQVNNAATSPIAKPSVFEADLCHGVLRGEGDVKKLLTNIGRLTNVLKSEIDTESNGSSSKKTVAHYSTTASITTTSKTRTAIRSNTDNPVVIEATAKQVAEDVAQANALFNVDELSRLRQPHLLERIFLSFPTLLSHAPVTYQRNLVRARFYFKSFPGIHFEERVGKWIEQGDDYQDRLNVEVNVDMVQSKSSSVRVQTRTKATTTVTASEHLGSLKHEE